MIGWGVIDVKDEILRSILGLEEIVYSESKTFNLTRIDVIEVRLRKVEKVLDELFDHLNLEVRDGLHLIKKEEKK